MCFVKKKCKVYKLYKTKGLDREKTDNLYKLVFSEHTGVFNIQKKKDSHYGFKSEKAYCAVTV